jgi:hypothetical protein
VRCEKALPFPGIESGAKVDSPPSPLRFERRIQDEKTAKGRLKGKPAVRIHRDFIKKKGNAKEYHLGRRATV